MAPRGDRLGPAYGGQGGTGHGGDGGGCRENQADSEQADGPDVRPEVPERREVGRGPQNGRQEDKKHEVGVEMHDGQFRHERQNEASDHQQNGIGNEQFLGDGGQCQHDHQQENDQFEQVEIVHRLYRTEEAHGAPPYRISCPEGDHRFLFPGVISPCI